MASDLPESLDPGESGSVHARSDSRFGAVARSMSLRWVGRILWRGFGNRWLARLVALLAVSGGLSMDIGAVEPWADARLRETNGLAMWFDVSRQNAARGLAQLAPLKSWADVADYLFDGSGNGRHVFQPLLGRRPRFKQEIEGALLNFDAEGRAMGAVGLGLRFTNTTIFVVAAPRSAGDFKALLSFNAIGRNDYTSGLNLDFGQAARTNLAAVNVEGAGFSGESNLLPGDALPFGRWAVFALRVGSGADGVRLFIDGQARGTRPRLETRVLDCSEFWLGARHYSNDDARPSTRDFFDGEIAEVLLYDRALSGPARASVESYLASKYAAFLSGSARSSGRALVMVSNPPPVHVMVPGFRSDRLPVELSNINNVKYRPDGTLVAAGYDGRVWLLKDTDGDGLEDKTDLFHDGRGSIRSPIGMALTPPNYLRGDGVFLAAKEKLVLVVDTDRDGRADREIVLATWTERSEQQGVDALGVAVAPDGSVYFSLGAASFTDGYLVDKATGQSRYPMMKERGTIQRVLPDFTRRETVCTGIRFAVALAFNARGDLFCTDQEGATWLPNGNPFDELLHVMPGRHYGFPPRHPRLLPGVIDEPSVFDYMPQHQSACGLNFNGFPGPAGGATFGSSLWSGDAIVTGYSRGKIWRTKLVPTPAGYVAQSQLLATLQELTIDACVSPRADLVVATHSGKPDWGSGPNGSGHLWRIRRDTNSPMPLAAWSAGPGEIRVAYDRPIDAIQFKDIARRAQLEAGQYVFPGDRFENVWPGYQVVQDQRSRPRSEVPILGAGISQDRRTLILQTRPRDVAWNGALTLPAIAPDAGDADLAVDLSGVTAEWRATDGARTESGWLPHLDSGVNRALGDSMGNPWFGMLGAGVLVFQGQLNLYEMLQPAIQPGAVLDYERPPETVRLVFRSTAPFRLRFEGRDVRVETVDGRYQALVEAVGPGRHWQSYRIESEWPPGGAGFSVGWSTANDSTERALPLRRFLLPWARPMTEDTKAAFAEARSVPEIAGGNWLHGRRLFYGERLACGRCHASGGLGGALGPDLSNLVHRDYASVRKDIEFPNAALNPDHVASRIEFADGEVVTALVRASSDGGWVLEDAGGQRRTVAKRDIRSMEPASASLMPEGLWGAMTESERRDLMTFLLMPGLEANPVLPVVQGNAPPTPRRLADFEALKEWRAVLTGQTAAAMASPLRVVLCASPKDAGHGAPGFHDYPLWRQRWAKLLSLADGVEVETAERWPTAEQWQRASLVVFYHDNPAWEAAKAADLDAYLARGGGVVFLHWSVNAYRDLPPLMARLGRAWGAGAKFRYGTEDLVFEAHDLSRGFPVKSGGSATPVRFTDEVYWNLPGDFAGAVPIASTEEQGAMHPQAWVREVGAGRVFVCIPGHFTWTFDDPLYRLLLLRGMGWAARQPVERWSELTLVGARFEP